MTMLWQRAVLLAVVLAVNGCVPRATPGTVTIERDRFSGKDVLRMQDMHVALFDASGTRTPPWRGVDLRAVAVDGDSVLSVDSVFERWVFLQCHHVNLLVDGTPIALGESEHDGSVLSHGGVIEHVSVALDPTALAAISAARGSIEFRVCASEGKLDAKQVATLRDFANRARAPSQPQ